MKPLLILAALAAASICAPVSAQKSAADGIAEYRKMLEDGNPAELFEAKGENLWKTKRGPKNASLEQCDLGQGAGVLKGAYAGLPRYFADVDRVMDLETRLLHCMMTLQGRSREEATKGVFGNADRPSEMEYLSAYIAGHSHGMPLRPGVSHAKERAAFELGQKLYFHRAGSWDFSCASCHGEEDKRIRMSQLPVLYKPAVARPLIATWPAYRVSNSQFKTMQWRMNDCYRQMRMPEPVFGSEAMVALVQFLTVTAQGEPYRGPAIKR